MNNFPSYFKALGTNWPIRALATSIALLTLIQVVFMGIQSQIAEKAEIAGRSIINGNNTSLNPYYFSQAISGLEIGALISCVEIRKIGQSVPFYESTPEYCENKYPYAFLLNGEVRTAAVKSANGEEWELKFRGVNGPLFSLALWALRISAVLFTFAFFFWAEWRVKTTKRIQEANTRVTTELAQFATQVAHDIRSPLAALNVLINSAHASPEDSRGVLKNVIQRINDIANSLLEKEKNFTKKELHHAETASLRSTLRQVVIEKEAEFRSRENLLVALFLGAEDALLSRGMLADFSRALSNLINNAAEAIGNKPGKISVNHQATQKLVSITIADDGPGIPPRILNKLGRRGFSFGKGDKGSGLGIFQAKKTVQEMGGDLIIKSSSNGTEITIQFPRATVSPCDIVLIDDDTSLHLTWQMAARSKKKIIQCFSSYAEVQASLHLIPKTADFYIDSLLAREGLKGEEVAKELYAMGYCSLSLCTGFSASSFPQMPWIKAVIGKEPPWL